MLDAVAWFEFLYADFKNALFLILLLVWFILLFTRLYLAILIVSILLLIFAFPDVLFAFYYLSENQSIYWKHYVGFVIFALGIFGIIKSLRG